MEGGSLTLPPDGAVINDISSGYKDTVSLLGLFLQTFMQYEISLLNSSISLD